jgi:mRNA-degrading endonuclease RelE of RelBE toxin-antitoxin system
MFKVRFAVAAKAEFDALRAFDMRRIADAINAHLKTAPLTPSRDVKRLDGLRPSFEHEPPVWELRVGAYRVFYDVDAAARAVVVRAIRLKGTKTTGEIT